MFEITPQGNRQAPRERYDTDAPRSFSGAGNRWLNQWQSRLLGWKRNQPHASSTINHRHRRLPALLIPSSTSLSPLSYGVGVKPGEPFTPGCDGNVNQCRLRSVNGARDTTAAMVIFIVSECLLLHECDFRLEYPVSLAVALAPVSTGGRRFAIRVLVADFSDQRFAWRCRDRRLFPYKATERNDRVSRRVAPVASCRLTRLFGFTHRRSGPFET